MQSMTDFVIISPLEEEREALLAHLGKPNRLPPTNDDIRVYYPAKIPVIFTDGTASEYDVVLTVCSAWDGARAFMMHSARLLIGNTNHFS
jgi:hypothetical protein